MSEPFLGEIKVFSLNFAPKGWLQCNGQVLPINQYQALFSLLGNVYGGDGRTTFALPNLQGRVPLHSSNGVGGAVGGEESHTLTINEIPQHTHQAFAGSDATASTPSGTTWGTSVLSNYAPQANVQMNPTALGTAGANQAHTNMQPYLVLNYCIAVQGIFPTRN